MQENDAQRGDAAQECRVLVITYLKYAIENARSALTLMGEPATSEAARNYVVQVLGYMGQDD